MKKDNKKPLSEKPMETIDDDTKISNSIFEIRAYIEKYNLRSINEILEETIKEIPSDTKEGKTELISKLKTILEVIEDQERRYINSNESPLQGYLKYFKK